MAVSIERIKKPSVSNTPSQILSGKISIRKPKKNLISLPLKAKWQFYEELHLLLNAGLDMENAMRIIRNEYKESSSRFVLMNNIHDSLIQGSALSKAMDKHGKFSDYEIFSIQIGEQTGKLGDIIQNLKKYYEGIYAQRKKLISSLSYPVVVLIVAICAVFFLLNFVVPLFEDVFSRFGSELPAMTKFIMDLSSNSSTLLLIIFLIALLILAGYYLNRINDAFRHIISNSMLRIPLLGSMLKSIYQARIFSALSLLISSKNPLLNSVSMVRKMIHFHPYQQSLITMEDQILSGFTLYQCLADNNLYDPKVSSLIKVAEEVGQMELVLKRVSETFSSEIENKMTSLASIIEPLLIIFVGSIVAIILIAMYLPMFSISSSFY